MLEEEYGLGEVGQVNHMRQVRLMKQFLQPTSQTAITSAVYISSNECEYTSY